MQHASEQCSLGACCEQAAAATPAAEPAVIGCGDSACVRMLKGKTPASSFTYVSRQMRLESIKGCTLQQVTACRFRGCREACGGETLTQTC